MIAVRLGIIQGSTSSQLGSHDSKPIDSTEQKNRAVDINIHTIIVKHVSNYSLKLHIKGVWVSF